MNPIHLAILALATNAANTLAKLLPLVPAHLPSPERDNFLAEVHSAHIEIQMFRTRLAQAEEAAQPTVPTPTKKD